MGSWAQALLCPPCLVIREYASASMTFLEFPRAALKQVLIREGRGCRDQGGAVKKLQGSLEAGPGPPSSRNIENNIFEFFLRTKPPPRPLQTKMLMKLFMLESRALSTSCERQCKLACSLILIQGCIFHSPNSSKSLGTSLL